MASNGVNKVIPLIDFSKPDLKPGTPQWESTKSQVFKAMQEFGCFQAIFDKVPNENLEAMFDALHQTLPNEKKLREYTEKPFHCYEDQIPHLPLYDKRRSSTDLLLPNSVETFSNTFWPNGNPNFCNMVKSFTNSLMELDEMVKRMILESLGLKHYIDEFLDPNFYLLRFTHYKADQNENKNNTLLGAHADGSFLTIVKEDQPGLEVLKDGEWIEFNVSPNTYVVLLEDCFMGWTNNRLKSAIHKVAMERGDIDRVSFQLFSSPKPGYTVEVPKELVDEEHPLLFKPFDILGYYQHVMAGHESGLKAYCGI